VRQLLSRRRRSERREGGQPQRPTVHWPQGEGPWRGRRPDAKPDHVTRAVVGFRHRSAPTDRGSVVATIAIALGSVFAIAVIGAAAAATGSGGPSSRLSWSPPGQVRDSGPRPTDSIPLPSSVLDLSWPWGQCTWFVAQHHRVTWGGDAADWLANARKQGVPSADSPSVGAIVVYRRGGPYDHEFGHVALVIAVTPFSYSVAEMHYIGLGRIDVRTVGWPDANVEGFIP